MTDLARYDAACAALDAAVTADEVMSVHITAKAIEAVGRVAKNIDLEIKAVRLRTRAEVRLGEMVEEGERLGIIAPRGRPKKGNDGEPFSPATMADVGIDKRLSSRARKLNGIGARAVAGMLDRMEQQSRATGRVASNIIDQGIAKRTTETRRDLACELSEATALSATGRKFPVLYADPAWSRKAGIGDRAYENNYVTMSWDEIIAMPVAQRLLPDAWGFIWVPRAHMLALHSVEVDTPLGRTTIKLPLIWAVARAWGFDAYSTCFIWTKTDDQSPNDHGLGLIAWDQDEVLCMFKRGNGLPKPDSDKKHGSNYRARAGRHSEKPAYYRDMIDDMTGGVPVLELFAREDDDHVLPPNFYTWGNQSNNSAERLSDDGSPTDPETGELLPNPPINTPSHVLEPQA